MTSSETGNQNPDFHVEQAVSVWRVRNEIWITARVIEIDGSYANLDTEEGQLYARLIDMKPILN